MKTIQDPSAGPSVGVEGGGSCGDEVGVWEIGGFET